MLTAFEMRELEKPFSLPLPNSRKSMDRMGGLAYIYIYMVPPPSDLPFVVVLSTFSKGSAPKMTKFHKIKVFQNTTAYVTVSIPKIPKLNTPSPKSKNSENSKNSKNSKKIPKIPKIPKNSKTKHPIS